MHEAPRLTSHFGIDQVWWLLRIISAFGREKQEDPKLKGILRHIVSLRPAGISEISIRRKRRGGRGGGGRRRGRRGEEEEEKEEEELQKEKKGNLFLYFSEEILEESHGVGSQIFTFSLMF
jgi:hypothetical protein